MSGRAIVAVVVVVLAALPWLLGGEHETLGDSARRRLPGRVASLKDGKTSYELQGPSPAELVVFVHGLASPSYIWGDLPRLLREAGYATLTYDLYGRGWSDRPWVTYDLDLFERQLSQLLRKVGVKEGRVHLVALSMGGVIASEFALRSAGSVASLTLIDPAGLSVAEPGGSWLMRLPLVADWLMQVAGNRILIAANERSVHDKSLVPELTRKYVAQLEFAGYKRAMLSTLRHMPLADFQARYEELGRSGIPVEVFWGTRDEITPIDGLDIAARLLPQAKLHRIEDAGHIAHYEKTGEVSRLLLDFLRARPASTRNDLR